MTTADGTPAGGAQADGTPADGAQARRGGRRRMLWRFGVAAAVALVAAGAGIGVAGYQRTSGPDGAVRAYFSAIAGGDAPRALSWGDVPDGPHTLLSSEVLRLQQRIAPLRDVRIGEVRRTGSRATVRVRYVLAFPGQDVPVSASVPVVERDGDWRLRTSAVVTQLSFDRAAHRAVVLGSAVPGESTPVFPGAVPVTFDTPYLELDPAQDTVGFGSGPLIDVAVQVSKAGRTAVARAVGARLTACFGGRPDTSCPLPDARFVPGSLRGSIAARDLDQLSITLGSGADGAVSIQGHLPVTGTYRQLRFDNRTETGRGQTELQVSGYVYPVEPLTVVWTGP